MNNSLIFDMGCHIGEDSGYYLKKGFKVVAVEANPSLWQGLRSRFSTEISEGRFTLIEKAIAEKAGQVDFFVSQVSIWGTIRDHMAERNAAAGVPFTKIAVHAVEFSSLIEEYGMPYYLKVDIEGADHLCIEALQNFADRPAYASVELEQLSVVEMRKSLKLMQRAGAKKFKIVNQGLVPFQTPSNPSLEGQYASHEFPEGASGLFGKELPDEWKGGSQSVIQFMEIYARNKLDGLSRKIPSFKMLRSKQPGWYDLHASFNG